MEIVSVTTGARLHFGPLSVAAPAGGRFGGVGVMIERPGFDLSARLAQSDLVHADADTTDRILEFLNRIRSHLQMEIPAVEIRVEKTIPSHCGFGSGTQLGLAVVRAISALMHEPELAAGTLARQAGRGLRSAVGLHGFLLGGFLVDGGRAESGRLGTLVARVDFPEEWRFVLAMPHKSIGLSGDAEQSTFASQPSMPIELTSELCRTVLMDWLPSVIESDFSRCSDSMYHFGTAVGAFFSNAQGGVFAHPRMRQWAELVRRRGVSGVAQTSWGPTLAAMCRDAKSAEQLRSDFANDASWNDCSFEVVTPLNRGASVSISERDR